MLTVLQEQLAQAHGLAIAVAAATREVEERTTDGALLRALGRLRADADETRARCLEAEAALGTELAEELLAHANTASERAAGLAGAWFSAGTGPLAAWTFLAMGEAAEVTAWSALRALSTRAGDRPVAELAEWALGVQQGHLRAALAGATRLAEGANPAAPRWG